MIRADHWHVAHLEVAVLEPEGRVLTAQQVDFAYASEEAAATVFEETWDRLFPEIK